MKPTSLGIIGFGRFGKVLYRLLKDDFQVRVYDPHLEESPSEVPLVCDLEALYEQVDVVFYAVPISTFEEVIKAHRPYMQPRHLLVDVLSVKSHPRQVLEKHVGKDGPQILLTHPMFGPDSARDGFEGLPMILDAYRTSSDTYQFWKNYFGQKRLQVIEMTADEHDQLAASSQGLSHFMGRLLEAYAFEETPIDSLAAQKLHEIQDQICHDSWQLFQDLQSYNPYTLQMRSKLGETFDRLYNRLLPEQANGGCITYGIQGDVGSFNEEAILAYTRRRQIAHYEIKYLHTADHVLKALYSGEIDQGQFAVHNSVGGIVDESLQAMAKYKFKIIEQFAIPIAHALMIHPEADYEHIDTIMCHPQVFAQCQGTLSRKHTHLKKISGEGELIDHALVAKYLSEGKLPRETATMGSRHLAQLYGLKIIEDNLQDATENLTSFLVVGRI